MFFFPADVHWLRPDWIFKQYVLRVQQSGPADTCLTLGSSGRERERKKNEKKPHLKTSKCSFYLRWKSPTDVSASVRLSDPLDSRLAHGGEVLIRLGRGTSWYGGNMVGDDWT